MVKNPIMMNIDMFLLTWELVTFCNFYHIAKRHILKTFTFTLQILPSYDRLIRTINIDNPSNEQSNPI